MIVFLITSLKFRLFCDYKIIVILILISVFIKIYISIFFKLFSSQILNYVNANLDKKILLNKLNKDYKIFINYKINNFAQPILRETGFLCKEFCNSF